ncbi:hypothetical protein L218DRAFT_949026 [Marasmius fiardii PR-910]|nr:hypothetical protein L218DRAFT_949026 [Marasmius fiardii PR-910]
MKWLLSHMKWNLIRECQFHMKAPLRTQTTTSKGRTHKDPSWIKNEPLVYLGPHWDQDLQRCSPISENSDSEYNSSFFRHSHQLGFTGVETNTGQLKRSKRLRKQRGSESDSETQQPIKQKCHVSNNSITSFHQLHKPKEKCRHCDSSSSEVQIQKPVTKKLHFQSISCSNSPTLPKDHTSFSVPQVNYEGSTGPDVIDYSKVLALSAPDGAH